MEWNRDSLQVTDDRSRIDLDVVHGFLRHAYWATGIPRETVQRSIEHSMCFSVFENGDQIGFARVITDKTTFAYLSDVFVVDSHRGKGASRWLMECILNHPDLQNLKRWMLITDDAHGLYRKFGFKELAQPHRHMEISRRNYPQPTNENAPHGRVLPNEGTSS